VAGCCLFPVKELTPSRPRALPGDTLYRRLCLQFLITHSSIPGLKLEQSARATITEQFRTYGGAESAVRPRAEPGDELRGQTAAGGR